MNGEFKNILKRLDKLIEVVERVAPASENIQIEENIKTLEWDSKSKKLIGITPSNLMDLSILISIEEQKRILLENTLRFAEGFPYNNALLWGARGMGKSTLVKSVHSEICKDKDLVLVEISREDINEIPILLRILSNKKKKFILFCDDLSFDKGESSYKSLKSILEGGIQGRPRNIVFYATSNRRHLLEREKNSEYDILGEKEITEENISLSDRFGLWIGFHGCDQATYLSIVEKYSEFYKITTPKSTLHKKALEWGLKRGSRSGRVAWQFFQDHLGKIKFKI